MSGRSLMCSKKSVGAKIEPRGLQYLLDMVGKTFHPEPLEFSITKKKLK